MFFSLPSINTTKLLAVRTNTLASDMGTDPLAPPPAYETVAEVRP